MPRSAEFPHTMLASFTPDQWTALGALAEGKRWPKTEVLRWLVESVAADSRSGFPNGDPEPVSARPVVPPEATPGQHPIPPTVTTSSPGLATASGSSAPSRSDRPLERADVNPIPRKGK